MYTMLTNRRDDKNRDEGFTLIELMVVVLIIAILLAIAIPTFLGAQSKAKDRGAQSTARNALTSAKTIYADNGDYAGATIAALTATEPSVTFLAGASTGSKVVSVVVPATGAKQWHGAVKSGTGTCYYVRDSIDPEANPGTMYAKDNSTTCTAAATLPAGLQYTTDGWDNVTVVTTTVAPAGG